MEKKLTDEQRIKLAEVLGYKVSLFDSRYLEDSNGIATPITDFDPDSLSSPFGAAYLRDLWLDLDKKTKLSILTDWNVKNFHYTKLQHPFDFMDWFFQNPYEACLLILEVVE